MSETARAPRITTAQGGLFQISSKRKARMARLKSLEEKIALVLRDSSDDRSCG
jgi:hypothetical protein